MNAELQKLRELQERKAKKRINRDGNFVLEGGRMIYDPK